MRKTIDTTTGLRDYWALLKDVDTILDAIEDRFGRPKRLMITIAWDVEEGIQNLDNCVTCGTCTGVRQAAEIVAKLRDIAENDLGPDGFTSVVDIIGLHPQNIRSPLMLPDDDTDTRFPIEYARDIANSIEDFITFQYTPDGETTKKKLLIAGLEVWADEEFAVRCTEGDCAATFRLPRPFQTADNDGMRWQANSLWTIYNNLNHLRQSKNQLGGDVPSRISRVNWWQPQPIEVRWPVLQDHENSLFRYHFSRAMGPPGVDPPIAIVGPTASSRPAPDTWVHPISGMRKDDLLPRGEILVDYYYDLLVSHYPAYYYLAAFSHGLPIPNVPVITGVTVENNLGNPILPPVIQISPTNSAICVRVSTDPELSSGHQYYLMIDGIPIDDQKAINSFGELEYELDLRPAAIGETDYATISTPSRHHRLSLSLPRDVIWPQISGSRLDEAFPPDRFGNPNISSGQADRRQFGRFETGYAYITISEDGNPDAPMQEIYVSDFGDAGDPWDGWTASTAAAPFLNGGANPSVTNDEVKFNGAGVAENKDPSERDHGMIRRTISTEGFKNIIVTYETKRSGSLLKAWHGLPDPMPDDETPNDDVLPITVEITGEGPKPERELNIDDQLMFSYNHAFGQGGAKDGWASAEIVPRQIYMKHQDGETIERIVDLSLFPWVEDNENFALRFAVQLNTTGDTIIVDNVRVLGEPISP